MLQIRRLICALILLTSPLASAADGVPTETWKGPAPDQGIQLGFLTGPSIWGTHVDLALMGTLSKLLIERGFVPDITNQVFLEVGLGPDRLASPGSGWIYSFHLRWDFHMDEQFAVYAVGGLGGAVDTSGDTNIASAHPRLSAGVLLKTGGPFSFRGEVGADFLAAGVIVGF
ncbi:MAG: hypothetical protein IT285_12665 [Bdellovibrionales bacterium]|nr:hypothetical protein [Bdellovibrionales bacterium]